MTESSSANLDVIEAARKGSLEMLEAALAAGGQANESDGFGNSALMYAAVVGNIEICRRLIAAGANTSHANKWNLTARDWAKWSGEQDDLLPILRGES